MRAFRKLNSQITLRFFILVEPVFVSSLKQSEKHALIMYALLI